jgi:hypothetical protein
MTRRKVETLLTSVGDERSLKEMKPCRKAIMMSVGGKEMLAGGGETAEGLGMGARERKPCRRPRDECRRKRPY